MKEEILDKAFFDILLAQKDWIVCTKMQNKMCCTKEMLVNLYAYKYVKVYCDRQVCYDTHFLPVLLTNFSIMLVLSHSGHRFSEQIFYFFNLKKNSQRLWCCRYTWIECLLNLSYIHQSLGHCRYKTEWSKTSKEAAGWSRGSVHTHIHKHAHIMRFFTNNW